MENTDVRQLDIWLSNNNINCTYSVDRFVQLKRQEDENSMSPEEWL